MNAGQTPTKKMLMLGPSLKAPGGMTSVALTLKEAGLFDRFDVEYLSTYEKPALGVQFRVMWRAILRVLRLLLTRQVTLIHAHSASRGSFLRKSFVCAWARLFRVPYVFHMHCGEFTVFYQSQCGAMAKWWVRRTLRNAASVICLAENWRAQLALIEPKARVRTIGNPVAVPNALPALRERPTEVLFLGRLREKKGVFDLIRAIPEILAQCPQFRFVLAGDEGEEAVRMLAEELGVADAIVLPGWVDGDRKTALLDSADIFVLPSYFEGLPVGLLEAMALGIPIVTTAVGGIPELIEDGVHGLLVPTNDPSALAKAIIRLDSDTLLRRTLRASAFERVQAHYATGAVVSELSKLYGELGCHRTDGGCIEEGASS